MIENFQESCNWIIDIVRTKLRHDSMDCLNLRVLQVGHKKGGENQPSTGSEEKSLENLIMQDQSISII